MAYITALKQRLAYAKVCVEVSTTSSIPSFVDVILQNDFSVSIGVGVPWLLPKCIKCSVFGHSNNACFVDPVGHVMAKGDTRKAVVVGKVKQKQSVSHFDLGPSRSGLEGLLGVAVIPFPTKSGKVNARGSNNQFAILSDDVNLVASIVDVNPAIDVCGDSVGDVFVFASDALGVFVGFSVDVGVDATVAQAVDFAVNVMGVTGDLVHLMLFRLQVLRLLVWKG
ncbi:hypothetical protein V6N12_030835 [Hibiscus sabdariffa]|uniref:Uncharacterized protein n=1 Tax=Hibiscus sabdariffa TaxID=183260 RepID=A0ABR2E765_9ROSI